MAPRRRQSAVTDGGGCESLRKSASALYRFLSVQLWMNRDVDDVSWKRGKKFFIAYFAR